MKTWKLVSLVLVGLVSAGAIASFVQKRSEGVKLNATEMPVPYEIADFTLTRTDGQVLSRKDFLGKYTLLYFGFTRCPDACPTTLAQWKAAIPKLSPDAKSNTQLLLVSVDPEHDTHEILSDYVKKFDPSIVAATGEQKELQKIANAMMTTFHKEGENAGDPDLYMMAHSPKYFLINPNAQLQAVYTPPIETAVLADDLNRLADKQASRLF
ncbi:MAG: SCO family protein [Bdellovibrionota bacterium]